MEEAGILRKTFGHQTPKGKIPRAKTDEEGTKASGHEILLVP